MIAAVLLVWPWRNESATSVFLPALSPYLAVCSVVAVRAIGGLFLLAVPVLILVLAFPRWFCRYGCPAGLLQETIERLRPSTANRRLRMPPAGKAIVLITLSGACVGYPVFLWLDPLALFNGFMNAWRQPIALASLLTGLGLPLLLLFDFVLPRVWCQRICPLGATQDFLALPRRWLRPPARCETEDPEEATTGRETRLGRRYFLAVCGAGLGALAARAVRGNSPAPLRPPGAFAEDHFKGVCVRCGNCARACPSRIIQPDLGTSGVAGLLTPVLTFEADYCREDCHRCNVVCPSGAIARMPLAAKRRRVIGPAQVDLYICLLAEGKECTACITHCPFEAIAIQTSADGFSTEPLVDFAKCTGCGACEAVCPVRPRRAIRVVAKPGLLKEDSIGPMQLKSG